MATTFFCQSCGAGFDVPPRLAGKRGRCRKCGQHLTIPRATELASMAAMPAVAAKAAAPAAPVAAGAAVAAPAATGRAAPSSALGAIDSEDVGLKPLSLDQFP